jgi:hypothetical protein
LRWRKRFAENQKYLPQDRRKRLLRRSAKRGSRQSCLVALAEGDAGGAALTAVRKHEESGQQGLTRSLKRLMHLVRLPSLQALRIWHILHIWHIWRIWRMQYIRRGIQPIRHIRRITP